MKTVNLQIDGKKIFAEEGTTILEAARQNGIDIPTLCYHPRLAPLGHCRVCIVDVQGFEKPITSCDNPVTEGMVVETSTPEIQEMRDQILILSLATHPYQDCLTCERTGSCELQEKAYNFKVDLPEQLEREVPAEKNEDNSYIVRDEEKCILCGRCVLVCRTGPGCFVYEMVGNGVNTRVVPSKNGKEVSMEEAGCNFCGQCVDVCPVAAITEKKRFAAGREWELSRVPGICVECSLGCSLERQASGNNLIKVSVPQEGEKVSWICQKGKFGVQKPGEEYLEQPLKLNGNSYSEISYDEAVKKAAKSLQEIKDKAGADALAVYASGKISNEESYLLQKLAREVLGTANVDLGVEKAWGQAYKGMNEITGPDVYGPTPATMQDAEALLVIGSSLEESHPVAAFAVQQAGRFNDAVIVRINTEEDQKGSWNEIQVDSKPGAETALFKAITAAVKGDDPSNPAKEAGVSVEEVQKVAEQLAKMNSCTVVAPAFFADADSEKVEALLAMAQAGGQLAYGRSDLLLLSRYSNATGIIQLGGSSSYGPGLTALNGKSGLSSAELAAAAGADKIKAALVFGSGLVGAKPDGLDFLVVSCLNRDEVPDQSDLVFPAQLPEEKTGTFINSSGQACINAAALSPREGAPQDWKLICDLAEAFGEKWPYVSLDDVRAEMHGVAAE